MFPETEIQNCIIHQLRNSSKYVSYKDLKALMPDLKAVYITGYRMGEIHCKPYAVMGRVCGHAQFFRP